jgi:penicillin G amidase
LIRTCPSRPPPLTLATVRRARPWRLAKLAAALAAAAAVLYVSGAGIGPLGALGPAFNPAHGVWSSAAEAVAPKPQTLRLAGLQRDVKATFERNGVLHVEASTDPDLFFSLGYLEARDRLFQMDALRRQGEGLISEVFGEQTLDLDRFELQLGLKRTAEMEWAQADPATRDILQAFTRGVNLRIHQDLTSGSLPLLYRFFGFQPRDWSPIDSLVIKGVMTQTLDFQTTPLDYALLVDSLGFERTMSWFPVLPPNEQHPYDTGPHRASSPAPIVPAPNQPAAAATAAAVKELAGLRDRLAALPSWAVAQGGNSNNWAVSGAKSVSGKPLLAGDPHLSLTLPAIWFQFGADSPAYHFSGVGIPGTPGAIIGRNRHLAWSLTNTQNQATLYYREQMDAGHPDQYLWRGKWMPLEKLAYDIPVRGRRPEHLEVKLTVHGPIISQKDQTYAVYWVGGLPSRDFQALRRVSQASTFIEFREALRDWHAPSQNFVYADDSGHIGLVSAGYYPIVAAGNPWLPLPGTGESDVVGTIPFDQVPQVYDPPAQFTFSANQREVGPDYPFYVGTAVNDFDPGYRANEIHRVLSQDRKFSVADMEALQNDTRDYLAGKLVPRLVQALDSSRLNQRESQALALLRSWDYRMEAGSPAASVWWTFWQSYLEETFGPWWKAANIKASFDALRDGMAQDLEVWTLDDPQNSAFTPPGSSKRTAPQVMAAAFGRAVDQLSRSLGSDPGAWAWGRLHTRQIRSLVPLPGLGYGPRASGGDQFTPNAASGYVSSSGPSWRFVVDLSTQEGFGVYPGGQSEDPVSDWYRNRVGTWWDGHYDPMLDAAGARAATGSVSWTLRP